MLIAPSFAIMPAVFKRAVAAATTESFNGKASNAPGTLVIVQMAGGNDGLNTIVPYTNDRYYDLRKDVALAQKDLIPINEEVGFHPSLTGFKEHWDEGKLAIVEGVGYPNPSFSHFESMDIWQSADLDKKLKSGWLGRYFESLDQSQSKPFQGMVVGGKSPLAVWSPKVSIPSVQKVSKYQLLPDRRYRNSSEKRAQAVLKLFTSSTKSTPYSVLLDNTMETAYTSSVALQNAHATYKPKVAYPETKLGRSLQLLAEAIVGDLGVKVGHVKIGGFDTHANQPEEHADLLKKTSDAMSAFYKDLKAHNKDRDVVIMTWSEFGRRVKSNASSGTDHGTAGPMFFLGTQVAGGFYGERPGLQNLAKNNFRFTTDFRAVYASVLEQILGVPSEAIIGKNNFAQIPILSS